MEKIETILTDCIRDIKSGKVSLNDCLDRYDSRRDELEPLIKVALNIHELPELKLDSNYKQASKNRLLHQIQMIEQKKSISFADIFKPGIAYQLKWSRIAATVLVIIIMLSMIAGGTAYAAQSSLPGDVLYPVKGMTEDARLVFASDKSTQVKLNLQFAQTRLDEMNKLLTLDPERVDLAIDGYKDNLNTVTQRIQTTINISEQYYILVEAAEKMQNQLIFCDNIIDNKPSFSKPVNQASDLALNQQVRFLEMLSNHNNLQAAQMNFTAMESRVQRAWSMAGNAQYQTMQEALLQYQQFNQLGERILRNSQASNTNSVELETLTVQMLSNYLDILDSVSQEIPQQYRESIATCRQMTSQFQTQAQNKHQENNAPGSEKNVNIGDTAPGEGEPSTTPEDPENTSGEQGNDTNNSGSGNSEAGKDNGKTDSGAGESMGGNGKSGNGSDETDNNPAGPHSNG